MMGIKILKIKNKYSHLAQGILSSGFNSIKQKTNKYLDEKKNGNIFFLT